mmetsp:Transcript_4115/g.9156  ORF Transcript_4115/g.9156 Transcript_4115/m.9156 type:complete len:220 (-) Transcript_4115:2611-3270(-)
MMNEHGEMDLDGMTPVQLAEKMMKEVDIDGDGQIDIEEFTEMMKQSSTDKSGTIQNNHRMSQLAKNVLIAHQKKIENSTIGRDTWLIHPLSNFHATWDLLVSLLILLTVVTMPLSLGWEDINEDFFAMNLIVDFIFLLDVCKNFCTGFEDENEAIIMDASLVRRNYLTGFFATDFFLFLHLAHAGWHRLGWRHCDGNQTVTQDAQTSSYDQAIPSLSYQ